MSIKTRLKRLEAKSGQDDAMCYPLEYFYGADIEPVKLEKGLSLADFYNQQREERTKQGRCFLI